MRARIPSHRINESGISTGNSKEPKKKPRGGKLMNNRKRGLPYFVVTNLDDEHDSEDNKDDDEGDDDDFVFKNRRYKLGRKWIRKLWLKLPKIQTWRYAPLNTWIRCQPPSKDVCSMKYWQILSSLFILWVISFIILRFYQFIHQPRNVPPSRSLSSRNFPIQIRIDDIPLRALKITVSESHDEDDDNCSLGCLELQIPSVITNPSSKFIFPYQLEESLIKEGSIPDYNGLVMLRLVDSSDHRVIYHNVTEDQGNVRDYSVRDDDVVSYYSIDDDFARDVYKTYENKSEIIGNGTCRRMPWHTYHFPNCNTFHEMNSAVNLPTFYGSGSYRMALSHTHQYLAKSEPLIWRQALWNPPYTYDLYEFTRMDALISERLTRYDGIVNIYGHCGLAVLSELLDYGNLEDTAILGSGYIQQQDLQDKEELKPQNELTPTSKLDLALEMAELIAILHEYPDGIIVHDDVQPSQFLFDKNGHLKLNDFNRAEILLWDDQAKKYCKYRNGRGNGNFRAPEEYFDKPLDEMIDVYSFGNNIYVLLTGLWPFYNYSDDRVEEVQEMIRNGETPFVDLRYGNQSLEEAFLIEIMVECWSYHSEERPDMISIVRQLKAAKQDVKRLSSRQDDVRRR